MPETPGEASLYQAVVEAPCIRLLNLLGNEPWGHHFAGDKNQNLQSEIQMGQADFTGNNNPNRSRPYV